MALATVAVVAAGALLISGGSGADPETPPALPGLPPPFLGTAVVGNGGLTAAIDAYGNVVDLRAEPAGRALIQNPVERQAAGTVAGDTGIQPWVRINGRALPMWRADRVRQRYLPGTNVLRTVAWFGRERVEVRHAVHGDELAVTVDGAPAVQLRAKTAGAVMTREPGVLAEAAAADRRWLARRKPLGVAAPPWAERMYTRSLLVLRALTDRRDGAVAAGARDGWAYVWPRDAGAVAIAFAAAGYRPEAQLTTRFLLGLGVEQFARFHGDGSPVPGRAAQGDEIGWIAAAAEAAGIIGSARQAVRIISQDYPVPWRDRADYWEGEPGDFLANAIASGEPAERIEAEFATGGRLAREAGGGGGIDSAAAWAVRPFPRPALFEPVRRTLLRIDFKSGSYGVLPGEGWPGGRDPWSAPAAWSAWAMAALARQEPDPTRAHGNRRVTLDLLERLDKAATEMGTIPERVEANTGIPLSTTPLAWSHAFAILALRELWPSR
jgi:glucoamylase